METKTIDGKKLARRIRTEAQDRIERAGLDPGLGVILVGDDPASHLYVRLKERACARAGIRFEKFVFPTDASQEQVVDKIRELNRRDDIHAILVQLPLPEQLDEDRVIAAIDPKKDVDGFRTDSTVVPGLAEGILLLAQEAEESFDGKKLKVISNSQVFAEPIERLFGRHGAEMTDETDQADIVVIAVGRPEWLTKDRIKPGATVIDVGTNRVHGRLVGDAGDLDGVAGAITPVPGGVGPVTVAMLIRNTVKLAEVKKESAS